MNYPIRIARYELVDASGKRRRVPRRPRRAARLRVPMCRLRLHADDRRAKIRALGIGVRRRLRLRALHPRPRWLGARAPSKITLTIAKGGRVSVRTPGAPPIASRAMSRVQILQGSEAT